ncbi:MAG: GNAT family N-acetyltransferase, partial [Bdellovibrionales bacterium]|nr:GNAT family N-acetyltransferase [Bdellovibrionales bacterium]
METITFIRRAKYTDATNMISAHRRSIREVCSKDYTPEQIAAWSGRNFQEEHWKKTMDSDHVWVISDKEDNIYGFGHLKFNQISESEIAGLYFVPEVIGLGIGKTLIKIIFNECKKRSIQTVSLTATKTAKRFYQNAGFEQIGPSASIKIGGLEIECFNMKA